MSNPSQKVISHDTITSRVTNGPIFCRSITSATSTIAPAMLAPTPLGATYMR